MLQALWTFGWKQFVKTFCVAFSRSLSTEPKIMLKVCRPKLIAYTVRIVINYLYLWLIAPFTSWNKLICRQKPASISSKLFNVAQLPQHGRLFQFAHHCILLYTIEFSSVFFACRFLSELCKSIDKRS